MRKGFEHYYRLTQKELGALWKGCVFVFDANVLLDLYRYTPATRDDLLSILAELKKRIWIPHQVALEFHRNRLKTVVSIFEPYQKVKGIVTKAREDILANLAQFSSKHPFMNIKEVRDDVGTALTGITRKLEKSAEQHPNAANRANEDDIQEGLSSLFEGLTGSAFDDEVLAGLVKEAERRYANKIPPGYMDDSKDSTKRAGDFLIWRQMIDFAKKNNSPVIFVTGEEKEDWWEINGSTRTGPRPELREEFGKETGQMFYMYETANFLNHAADFLGQGQKLKPAAVQEIQEVRRKTAYDDFLRLALAANAKITEAMPQFQRSALAGPLGEKSLWDEVAKSLAGNPAQSGAAEHSSAEPNEKPDAQPESKKTD